MTSPRPFARTARRLAFPLFTSGVLMAMAAVGNGCGGQVDPAPLAVPIEPPGIRPRPRDGGTTRPVDARAPVTRLPLPPQTTATEVDLGTAANGSTVTLEVPSNALGFNVVVTGEGEDEVGIEQIVSPTGETVLRNHVVVGGTFETSLGTGIAAASVPQNEASSAMPLKAGPWSITVSSATARPVKVVARIQISGDGVFHGGAANMHVYIPAGLEIEDPDTEHVVTAASAPTDASIEARLGSFFDALEATTGILRGDVTFHDVSAGLVKISTEASLATGFAVSKGVVPDGEQSIHVLLTNDLDFGEGTWGIASGIPGAATRTGTHASGVALAVTANTFADMDGLALLHEVGHFVGLNHTTEFVGGFVDPLAETPNCAGILDIDRPQTLDRCPDKDNLMFPTLWATAIRVTASQKRVYQGSPTYKAFVGVLPEPGPQDAGITDADAAAADAMVPDAAGFARTVPAIGEGSSHELAVRFTRSGRALTGAERFVMGGLCGSTNGRGGLGVASMRSHLGATVAHAELVRMANDPDLLGVIRMRARKMLAREGR